MFSFIYFLELSTVGVGKLEGKAPAPGQDPRLQMETATLQVLVDELQAMPEF